MRRPQSFYNIEPRAAKPARSGKLAKCHVKFGDLGNMRIR